MYEDYFSNRLAQLRNKKGVSAREMSLSLGQSENYINMIENRKSYPSMTVFFYICEYLNVTPGEFFEEGNTNPELLNDIVDEIKKIDDKALAHVLGFLKIINKK